MPRDVTINISSQRMLRDSTVTCSMKDLNVSNAKGGRQTAL